MLFCKHPNEAALIGEPQFARAFVWYGMRHYCGWCEDVGRYREALMDMVQEAESSLEGICGVEVEQPCGRCQALRKAQYVLSGQGATE